MVNIVEREVYLFFAEDKKLKIRHIHVNRIMTHKIMIISIYTQIKGKNLDI